MQFKQVFNPVGQQAVLTSPVLFLQDSQDPNPLIRALAVRTMGCIRVDKITEYLCDPLQRCLKVCTQCSSMQLGNKGAKTTAPAPATWHTHALGCITVPSAAGMQVMLVLTVRTNQQCRQQGLGHQQALACSGTHWVY